MKVLPSLLLLLLCGGFAALGSILSVDDGGVYSGITVRIGDDVPRQYCRRVIDGVQVGDTVQWASVIVFQDSSVPQVSKYPVISGHTLIHSHLNVSKSTLNLTSEGRANFVPRHFPLFFSSTFSYFCLGPY